MRIIPGYFRNYGTSAPAYTSNYVFNLGTADFQQVYMSGKCFCRTLFLDEFHIDLLIKN